MCVVVGKVFDIDLKDLKFCQFIDVFNFGGYMPRTALEKRLESEGKVIFLESTRVVLMRQEMLRRRALLAKYARRSNDG